MYDWLLLVIFLIILIACVCALLQGSSPPVMNDTPEYNISKINAFSAFLQKTSSRKNNIDIPIYYINLERCKERNTYMKKQFKDYGIKQWKRIQAVDGDTDSSVVYSNDFKGLTKGEIGCTLSHLRAIKQAYDNNLQYVLIIEDDVTLEFSNFWEHKLTKYIEEAPSGWTILQLFSDYNYLNNKRSDPYIAVNSDHNYYSTVSYIINRVGMMGILEKTMVNDTFLMSKTLAKMGAADYYIYNLLPGTRYLTNVPLFAPINVNIGSTIHDNHTAQHLQNTCNNFDLHLCKQLVKLTERAEKNTFLRLSNPRIIRNKRESPTQVDIVVAYYKHDLSWLIDILRKMDKKSYRLFIYSKHRLPMGNLAPYVHKWVELDNIGRCDHSFVHHIVDNYKKHTSTNTSFVKDSGIRHMNPSWITEKHDTLPIGPLMGNNEGDLASFSLQLWQQPHDQNENKDSYIRSPACIPNFESWAKLVMADKHFNVNHVKKIIYGAVFLYSSNMVHMQSIKTWIRAGLTLSYGSNIETGHYMERFWYYLFTENNNDKI